MEILSIKKEQDLGGTETPKEGSAKQTPRQPKGSEQTRKEIVINHTNVKMDMAKGTCGRSKGPNAKCCNGNMCRELFLKRDGPEGMEDLALISTVLLLRAELYSKDGIQVEKILFLQLVD